MNIFLYSTLIVSAGATIFLFQNCSRTNFQIDPAQKLQTLQTQNAFGGQSTTVSAGGDASANLPINIKNPTSDGSGVGVNVPVGVKNPTSGDGNGANVPVGVKNPTSGGTSADLTVVTTNPTSGDSTGVSVPVVQEPTGIDVPVAYYCSTSRALEATRVVNTQELTAYLADEGAGKLVCQQSSGIKDSIINKKDFKVVPCEELEDGKRYTLVLVEKSAFKEYLAFIQRPKTNQLQMFREAEDRRAFAKLLEKNSLLSKVQFKVSSKPPEKQTQRAVASTISNRTLYLEKTVLDEHDAFSNPNFTLYLPEKQKPDDAIIMFSNNLKGQKSSEGFDRLGFGEGKGYDETSKYLCDFRASPLIVSLGSPETEAKGIELTSPTEGILFDILGARSVPRPYSPKQISWLKKGIQHYYFITLPKQGVVEGIDQLFGDNTRGPDGKFAANGYLALAKYDLDKDHLITKKDAIFSELRLWRDDDRDGKAQPYELYTLEEMGVTKIDLTYDDHFKEVDQYGNETRMKSVVETKDGKLHLLFDLWFRPIMK